MSDPEPLSILPLLLSAGAVAVLCHLPLFGVDRELLDLAIGPGFTRIPVVLGPLALASLLTTARPEHAGRRVLLGVAVLLSGGLVWRQLEWLAVPFQFMGDAVYAPGTGLRALVTLSSMALHALLIAVAARVEGPRIHGLWWVVAVAFAAFWLPGVTTTWWLLAVDQPLLAALQVGGLVPALAAASVWAALNPQSPWIRSAADAGAVSLIGAALVGELLRGLPVAIGHVQWPVMAVVLLGSAAVVVVHGVQHRGEPRPAAALTVLPGLLLIGGVLAWGFVSDPSARERLFAPGPFAGEVDATVTIHADDAADTDVDVIRQRLDELRIDATVTTERAGLANLTLENVASVEEVLEAVLKRRAITLHAVVEDGDDAEVEKTLEACAMPPCETLRLGEAQLTSRDIAGAEVIHNEYTGRPGVLLEFSTDGGRRFGEWTEAMVERRIAIVLDDVVMSAPTVREPIRGGSAQVEVGDTQDALREATSLAVALRTPPLLGTWTVR